MPTDRIATLIPEPKLLVAGRSHWKAAIDDGVDPTILTEADWAKRVDPQGQWDPDIRRRNAARLAKASRGALADMPRLIREQARIEVARDTLEIDRRVEADARSFARASAAIELKKERAAKRSEAEAKRYAEMPLRDLLAEVGRVSGMSVVTDPQKQPPRPPPVETDPDLAREQARIDQMKNPGRPRFVNIDYDAGAGAVPLVPPCKP